jgi:signal transduction histidine kinase
MFTFIVILSVFAQSLVALFVLLKNHRNLTNVLFFILSVLLITWAVINFVITRDPFSSSQLLLYRFLLASVIAQNTFFFLFAHTYPEQKVNVRLKYLVSYLTLSVVAVTVTLTPLVFASVNYGQAGARPVPGPGMLLFVLHALISVISGLRTIYKGYKNSFGISRQQFRFIFFGSVILWGVVPFTNFFISMATQTLFFARISPIYTLAFSSIIAYAILTQKLFDIRLAVARSVAYLLSLGFIGLIYGSFIFILSSLDSFSSQATYVQRSGYIGFALVTAALYPGVKRFFDKLTDKIFYQDAYDPEAFLDQLNQALVTNIELEKLLKACAQIIADNLKTEYCLFGIKETGFRGVRAIGTIKKDFSLDDIMKARQTTPHLGTNVVVTDYLPPEAGKFKRLLVKNDVAALVRLVPEFASARDGLEGLGYIVLGQKRSGNTYESQDIQMLGIIANELVIAIQNALHFEEIQRFNVTLQERVDKATYQLRRTNQKLEELDETKDDFISMASHQLRTPLTSVKGYLSMVLEGDAGKLNATQSKMLGQAFISSQRMVYLITDLLNVSRLKTGKFVIDAVPTNLSEIVEEEVSQLVETGQARSIELTYIKPAEFPALMLDETKTRQVIMNFIDNAIYYTRASGHIQVKLTNKLTSVEFEVTDDGIGVPRSEQHHLFTKFYRAANARRARPDGTGLGLFMAKKVIVAQGGSIVFKSKEGQGSTFGFVFPKSHLKIPG